jgi:23S rRNA pseudouridine1911/1915/1917 synthase
MDAIDFQWLFDEENLKEGLQKSLNCSGQLLKKFYSSKDLKKQIKSRSLIQLPIDLVNYLQINPTYIGPEVKILTETKDYLAVHKPSGLHSHPQSYSDKDTVLNFLVSEKKWDVLNTNSSQYDRGLLYRLDQPTSGVLLLAKNEEFFHRMRDHFRSQMKKKFYLAVVRGSFNQEGEWGHYFRPFGPKGAMQSVSLTSSPEASLGQLKVVKVMENNGMSLLLINLSTGLRHQIRAQLAALGFPIVGDELYGGVQAERLFLHAWRYEWDELVEDCHADLFNTFFDLNTAFQVCHNMLRIF